MPFDSMNVIILLFVLIPYCTIVVLIFVNDIK